MDGDRKRQLEILLTRLGVGIPDDAALAIYDRALTHRSYTGDPGRNDNERLEFFGDCILDFLIGRELYESFDERAAGLRARFPGMRDEALLTDMLHGITNDLVLSEKAAGIEGFENAIRRGAGQALNDSIRAGAFEAFAGALAADGGIDTARRVVTDLFREEIAHAAPLVSWKNRLQECVQKREKAAHVGDIIRYRTSRLEGTPDHDARHTSAVCVRTAGVGWVVWGTGRGRRGKDAEMAAARDACRKQCGNPG